MKICPECKKEYADNAQFCSVCGSILFANNGSIAGKKAPANTNPMQQNIDEWNKIYSDLTETKEKMKKKKTTGLIMIGVGFFLFFLTMLMNSPIMILAVFVIIAGALISLRGIGIKKIDKTTNMLDSIPEIKYIPEDFYTGTMEETRKTFEYYFLEYGNKLLKGQKAINPTEINNKMNYMFSQFANLPQFDDETLFMFFAYLYPSKNKGSDRADVQVECVFRHLYKRYATSLEIIIDKLK